MEAAYYYGEEEKEPTLVDTLKQLKELLSKKKKKHRNRDSSNDESDTSESDSTRLRKTSRNRRKKELYPAIKSVLEYPPKGTPFPGYSGNNPIYPLYVTPRPNYTTTSHTTQSPYYARLPQAMPSPYYTPFSQPMSIPYNTPQPVLTPSSYYIPPSEDMPRSYVPPMQNSYSIPTSVNTPLMKNYVLNNIGIDNNMRQVCENCSRRDADTKILSCSHSICSDCLRNNIEEDNVSCPVCRKSTGISNDGITNSPFSEKSSIPADYYVFGPKLMTPKEVKVKYTSPIVYRTPSSLLKTAERHASRRRSRQYENNYVVWPSKTKGNRPFTFFVKSVKTAHGNKVKQTQEVSIPADKTKSMTIYRIKELVCHKRRMQPDDYYMTFENQILDDDEKLANLDFIQNKKLRLRRKKGNEHLPKYETHNTEYKKQRPPYSYDAQSYTSDDLSVFPLSNGWNKSPSPPIKSRASRSSKSQIDLSKPQIPLDAAQNRTRFSSRGSSVYESLLSSAYESHEAVGTPKLRAIQNNKSAGYQFRSGKSDTSKRNNAANLLPKINTYKSKPLEPRQKNNDLSDGETSTNGYEIKGTSLNQEKPNSFLDTGPIFY